jgi:tetratricopeptide (TPR) repeat protein
MAHAWRTWLFVCCLLVIAAASPRVHAQEQDEYQALIQSAISEMDQGQYMEALGLFRRAHELRPSARTLRGIGMAQFELRDYAGSIHALTLALDDPRLALTADLRNEASALMARARTFVARLRLVLDPIGATVRLDGLEVAVSETLLLNPGPHSIEASATGHQSLTRQVITQAGQEAELVLRLVPDAVPPPAAVDPLAPAARDSLTPAHSAAESKAWADRPVGVWLFIGAAAFAGGAAEGAVWWAQLSRDLDHCDRSCLERDELKQRRNIARALTFSLAGLSASSLAIAIVWQRRVVRPRLACAALPGGAACSTSIRY